MGKLECVQVKILHDHGSQCIEPGKHPAATTALLVADALGRDLVAEFKTKGYTTFIGDETRDDFRAYTPKKGDKVLAPLAYSALGMEID
ncbi:MAG: hypothetical protein GY809_06945, partial [Planctomycetes bacterium]|nr:hypothetical protein [Planctomycetota bacterium]